MIFASDERCSWSALYESNRRVRELEEENSVLKSAGVCPVYGCPMAPGQRACVLDRSGPVESAVVVYRGQVISASRGKPTQVEFDFESVWEFKKSTPDFFCGDLWWIHVHPTGYGARASLTDLNCARGLRLAFGSVDRFMIICFHDDKLTNIRGEFCLYRLEGDELEMVDEGGLEGDNIAWILKALSVSK